MLANDLLAEELLRKDPKFGFPLFSGQRVLITGVATLKRFYQDLHQMIGSERAAVLCTRLGYDTGLAGGMGLKDMYQFNSPDELIKAHQTVIPMTGMAKEVNSQIEFNPAEKRFRYSGEWLNSFESLIWNLNQTERSPQPVCHMLCGLASGYFSAITGRDILVKELSCRAQGNESCRFEARPINEWEDDRSFFHQIIKTDLLDDELEFLRIELNRSKRFLEKQKIQIQQLKEKQRPIANQNGIIYRNPKMADLLDLAKVAAPNSSTILIQGESGTGKEVIARYIHEHSNRSNEPFLAINCAAIPSSLIESELFGHTKGAFTGADKEKIGLFIEAGKGTIFLDEIGELAFDVQAKLLRVLQEKEVMPVGSVKTTMIKARTIAATNQDLKQMVDDGKFRNDLYYRISVFPLFIIPLRERREDILVLARHFLSRLNKEHPGFTAETVRRLQSYDWPGNIRELENCVEYAFILSKNNTIQTDHLPLTLSPDVEDILPDLAADFPTPKELVKRYAKHVVEHTEGNKTKAAKLMGVSIPTLWRYLKTE